METRKRTPEEILDALEEQAMDDDIERVLSLRPDEVDRELEAHGIDPEAVRAGGEAAFERAMQKRAESLAHRRDETVAEPLRAPPFQTPNAEVARARPSAKGHARRPAVRLVAAALAASVALVLAMNAATIVAWWKGNDVNGYAAGGSGSHARARALRKEAAAACAAAHWPECESMLDAAQQLDPEGEDAKEVRDMRKAIEASHRTHTP
jgi:hypothetical protein